MIQGLALPIAGKEITYHHISDLLICFPNYFHDIGCCLCR